MQVTPKTFAQLRSVFGDCIPQQNAAAMLDASPVAPQNAVELQSLRALLAELAGKKLAELAPASTSTAGRAMPAGTSLQIAQVHAARELRTPDGLLKVLSEKKAAAVFADIVAMKDVPHNFVEDGCLHRAHVIAKRLEDAGIFTEKILTIPTSGDLVMNTPKAKLGYSVVWYHEAVCVHVQTAKGDIERRVLDVTSGDKPLTVEEWLATMHPSPANPDGTPNPENAKRPLETFFLPRFAYGLGDRNEPPSTWRERDLASAFKWNEDWKLVQKDYEEGGFYDSLPGLAGRA